MLTAERIARDSHTWRNTTIAREAYRKAELIPDEIAFYFDSEPDITYREIADEARAAFDALDAKISAFETLYNK